VLLRPGFRNPVGLLIIVRGGSTRSRYDVHGVGHEPLPRSRTYVLVRGYLAIAPSNAYVAHTTLAICLAARRHGRIEPPHDCVCQPWRGPPRPGPRVPRGFIGSVTPSSAHGAGLPRDIRFILIQASRTVLVSTREDTPLSKLNRIVANGAGQVQLQVLGHSHVLVDEMAG